ncbi:MAG: two-component regulator propeller domain-containing protein [Bacteroidota bacterium]
MILRRHFLVWVFLIVGSHGYAQEFPFIQFGQNEGLAHLQIMDITQDRNGNLWLGTATRSVYRFDGKSFFQYKVSIKENSGSLLTLKVLPDTLNQLWILTNLGLVKFDGEKAALIYQEGNLLPGFACRLFKDQSEKVWIIDNNGSVFEMLNDTLRHRKDIMDQVKGKISGYTHDNKKDLVFYSFDGNSVVVNKDRSVRRDTLPRRTEGALFAIVKTTDSEIVASESGVVEFSGGNKVHIALPDSLRDLRVRQIEKDRDGLIWLLKGGTLMVIDKNKKLHLVNRAGNQLSNGCHLPFQR